MGKKLKNFIQSIMFYILAIVISVVLFGYNHLWVEKLGFSPKVILVDIIILYLHFYCYYAFYFYKTDNRIRSAVYSILTITGFVFVSFFCGIGLGLSTGYKDIILFGIIISFILIMNWFLIWQGLFKNVFKDSKKPKIYSFMGIFGLMFLSWYNDFNRQMGSTAPYDHFFKSKSTKDYAKLCYVGSLGVLSEHKKKDKILISDFDKMLKESKAKKFVTSDGNFVVYSKNPKKNIIMVALPMFKDGFVYEVSVRFCKF